MSWEPEPVFCSSGRLRTSALRLRILPREEYWTRMAEKEDSKKDGSLLNR
jgi:hypothetical protein